MKTTCLIFLVCLLSIGKRALAQSADTLKKEWIRNDINLVKTLDSVGKNNPAALEDFFLQPNNTMKPDTLGFGWTMFSRSRGAGYIRFNANFYHYRGKIVSYQLYSQATTKKELKQQYRQMLASLLPIDSGGIYYYKYHVDELLKPVANYNNAPGEHISTRHLTLMSPTDGIMYGYGGGPTPTMLYNRRIFNNAKDRLNNSEIIALMYAINPATRLMAFEYYLKYRKRFTNHKAIEAWMQEVYKNKPFIETISGCFIIQERAEKLVNWYRTVKTENF